MLHENSIDSKDKEVKEYLIWMDSFDSNRRKYFEALGASLSRPIPSVEKMHVLKEKPLPTHLRYAYLGISSTLMVIISSSLLVVEEKKLLRVLRTQKGVIGWSLVDIKGI